MVVATKLDGAHVHLCAALQIQINSIKYKNYEKSISNVRFVCERASECAILCTVLRLMICEAAKRKHRYGD